MTGLKPYPDLTTIELGWTHSVPDSWRVLPCRGIVVEKTKKNEDLSDENYLSLMANLGVIPYEEKGDVGNKKPDDLTKCKLVKKGDLVINSMNYGIGSYGLSSLDGVCSPVYIVLRPIENIVHERYALRIFESKLFQKYAQSFGTGILEHRAAIGWDDLKNIKVGIPTLAEQSTILGYLDQETSRIDTLIQKKTRFIELLREKRQAVITQAVTKGLDRNARLKDSGVAWVGYTPEHWSVCKLSFRYAIELGKMLDEKRITRSHLVPYLRNQDVQWGVINIVDLPEMDITPDEAERYTVSSGDLLVCEGGDVGRSAIWRGADKVLGYQKALHRLRPRTINMESAEYFYFAMFAAKTNGAFDESDSKATISHLPAEKFRQYRFAFPPIAEQVEIAEYLTVETERLDVIVQKTEQSIALLNERRAALITAAVTGQIDLREAA